MPPFTFEFDVTERTTQRITIDAPDLADAIEGVRSYDFDNSHAEIIDSQEWSIDNIRTVPAVHICMSAFDAEESYTDNPDEIRGWTVYARFDPEFEGNEPFELNDQRDYGSEDAAMDYVEELKLRYNTTDFRKF